MDRRTRRLQLRPIRLSDLGSYLALFSMPALVAHRPNPRPDPPAVITAGFHEDLARWQQVGIGRWAMEADGLLIGFGGLASRPGYDGLNISYHLFPDYWKQGYALEFVNEAAWVACNLIRAEQVFGLVRAANPASRRVLENAGFIFERVVDLGDAPSEMFVLKPLRHGNK